MEQEYDYIAAQCAELMFWLGWLRSIEVFSLRVQDIEMTPPHEHGRHNLPPGVGVILLRLLPSTKSSSDKQADMVIAWETSGGLCLGYWLTKLYTIMRSLKWYRPSSFIFRNTKNTSWNSYGYRHQHLYPLLTQQLHAKDPLLRHLPITSDNDIKRLFCSLPSYRRGAKSHCQRKRPGCHRAAYPYEKTEHGRWRIKNMGNEDMPTHYTEASIEDRVYLTLLCF